MEGADEQALGRDALYISKPWLMGFKKRQSLGTNPLSPTAGITCPHGDLVPETRGVGARREAVPREVFGLVERYWLKERKAAAAKAAAAAARKKAGGKGSGREAPGE